MFEKVIKVAAGMFYLAFGILGVAVAVLILKVLNIPDPAGWVQAVGSIGAIGGAVWIANDQYRRQKRERLEGSTFEASVCCDNATSMIEDAIRAITGISTLIQPALRLQFITMLERVFEGLVADMSHVNLSDMRNSDAVQFAKAKSLLRKQGSGLTAMLLEDDNHTLDDLVMVLNKAKRSIGEISSELAQSRSSMHLL